MARYVLVVFFISTAAASLVPAAASPAVTIDADKNFCIDGQPTFLIGTMGGDANAWQNYLAPAGFNFRFLGSTASPGAHSAGLWELPDVFPDPSAITTMKNDPSYLMWDLDYEIDRALLDQTGWLGHSPVDIVSKRQQCIGYDNVPPRPVGVCWGNTHEYYGSEFWGRDGYWHSYRHYAQLGDYFVAGEYNWPWEETISHAVRMTNRPVIALNRCWPIYEAGSVFCPTHEEVQIDFWQSVVVGARGIVLDRYEMQDSSGNWRNWVANLDYGYWDIIKKAASEIASLSDVLCSPGQWMYYKARPSSTSGYDVIYTFRRYGSDVYMIACNLWPHDPRSLMVSVPIYESNVVGDMFFDYLATGAIMLPPTSTTITDTAKQWTPDQLAGQRLWIRHGTPAHDHYYPILGNGSNTITIASGDLLADGVSRFDIYKVVELVPLVGRTFALSLEPGGRKVIRFPNCTPYYQAVKTPAPVGVASNRKWIELMDYSDRTSTEKFPGDAYGMCYDSNRHRLIVHGGLCNPWPGGKPNPWDADVWSCPFVWEWDLDTGYCSGRLWDGDQQGGDPWPGDTTHHDMIYDPIRQCALYMQKDLSVLEWRGVEQGWRIVSTPIPDYTHGPISHYAACYDPSNQRFLLYGGKDWTELGANHRGFQFIYEWSNILLGFDGTDWYNLNNPDVNLPMTALEEPVMCWDTSRNMAVLFGLSHDGRYSRDTDPQRYFQDTPHQTYTLSLGTNATRRYTAHVPYVYANYQMVFDPRTNTTLLFGGLPSINGSGTDLYEYNGADWTRLDYRHETLPAQDARRIPTLTYDPDHQMVLFLDTRQGKIWGLTSGLETEVTTIQQARNLPNNALVSIGGMTVSRCFDGYFYIQDADRTAGIRVSSPSTAVTQGSIVNVIGNIDFLPTGEKQITARVVGVAGNAEVRPLAMKAKSLGGAAAPGVPGVFEGLGLNNVGLLVTVFGSVTYPGADYIYIDDGSGLSDGSGHIGVKVVLNGTAAPPQGQYVAVTGVSGIETIAGHSARVALLSRADDLIALRDPRPA